MKTSELIGAALDWAVAKCEGIPVEAPGWNNRFMDAYGFSTDWSQGGPIIEREEIDLAINMRGNGVCYAFNIGRLIKQTGPTPLIAAMRYYVASKLGDEVDVPEELR